MTGSLHYLQQKTAFVLKQFPILIKIETACFFTTFLMLLTIETPLKLLPIRFTIETTIGTALKHFPILLTIETALKLFQCSKLRVHPAPGVHILVAGCIDFETCAPGVCMLFATFE